MSTPQPVRLFRNAQRTQKLIHKLTAETGMVTKEQDDAIAHNLILYAEHTWGHSASHTEPNNLMVHQLDARKAKYAVDADIAAGSLLDRVSLMLGEGEFRTGRPFEYTVINPHAFPLETVVYLPVDYWEAVLLDNGFHIVDGEGGQHVGQRTDTLRGCFIAVMVALSAGEHKKLQLVFLPSLKSAEDAESVEPGVFENDFYRLKYGSDGIESLINKKSGSEMLISGERRLGQPVYQIFPGGLRGDAAGANYGKRRIPRQEVYDGTLTGISVVESGPIFTVVRAQYTLPGCQGYSVDYTLFANQPVIEMKVYLQRIWCSIRKGFMPHSPLKRSMDTGIWTSQAPSTSLISSFQRPAAITIWWTGDLP